MLLLKAEHMQIILFLFFESVLQLRDDVAACDAAHTSAANVFFVLLIKTRERERESKRENHTRKALSAEQALRNIEFLPRAVVKSSF